MKNITKLLLLKQHAFLYNLGSMNELKHENFKRIAQNRKNKIISTIEQLNNLSNFSYYEFTEEEIKEMFDEINSKTEEIKKRLLSSCKKQNKKGEM